ncbi:MAG TPA: OmpA family protein [Polyangiaceae bacterium]|nr:OmpA family protein [Polyangiaceae bacterium]
MKTSSVLLAVTIFSASACAGSEPAPARAPQAETPAPRVADSPTKSVVSIAPEIRSACGIADADAYFAFDSARVRSSDYQTLDKLVRCFTTGPLAHREMHLVGHTDPRGGEEYNMVLAGSRADGVKAFLVGRGLGGQQVATTSRGELDAKGTDERSWAADRRVDVRLAD